MSNRESRYERVARLAYDLTSQVLPRYSHPKSPHHFTLPQLASCVLLMFYLDLSYRDMEEWLLATDTVCRVLNLPRVPDHSTLQRTFTKLHMLDWHRLKEHLLDQFQPSEAVIAVDSTGFSFSQASSYYQGCKQGRTMSDYVKGGYAIGTPSQFVLGWRTGYMRLGDPQMLPSLRRQARRYGQRVQGHRHWILLGDAGFDGNTLQEGDLIPPVRRGGKLRDPQRRARRLGCPSATGWVIWTTLEMRNGELGDQA